MDTFKVIAFTHQNLPLNLIGKLHLTPDEQSHILMALKVNFDFEEVLFLSTCNRIELFLRCPQQIGKLQVTEIARFLNSRLTNTEATLLAEKSEYYTGAAAVEHVFRVASSLESLVVGEREIITQVRKAYDFCNGLGVTGDFMRLLIKQTIVTAKDIYTNTGIAKNSVSVAALAYRQLRELGIRDNARIVFVGSGETNSVLAGYFQKHHFANFTVFNRTLSHAEVLATTLKGKAYPLEDLSNYKEGFDVLVVCTASSSTIITHEIYGQLLAGDSGKKVIIDLGVPANVASTVALSSHVHYIDINSLRAQSEINLQLRKNEIQKCDEIIRARSDQFYALHRERRIEIAFSEVPRQVKEIRELALREVFAKDVNGLDDQGRLVLDRVLSYMEKKYNAVAIKTAKEVFLEHKIQRRRQD